MTEIQVLPIHAINQKLNSGWTDSIFRRNRSQTMVAVIVALKYFASLLFGKFAYLDILACWSTSFANAVMLVVFGGSKKEMVGVNARWIVAFVTNVESIWRPAIDRVRHSSGIHGLTGHGKFSVTSGCRPGPVPTLISPTLYYTIPESFFVALCELECLFYSHRHLVSLSDRSQVLHGPCCSRNHGISRGKEVNECKLVA